MAPDSQRELHLGEARLALGHQDSGRASVLAQDGILALRLAETEVDLAVADGAIALIDLVAEGALLVSILC